MDRGVVEIVIGIELRSWKWWYLSTEGTLLMRVIGMVKCFCYEFKINLDMEVD